jgi:hypothetical protein
MTSLLSVDPNCAHGHSRFSQQKDMTDALPQKYVPQHKVSDPSREVRNDYQTRYASQMIEMYMTTTPSLEDLRHTHETRLHYLRNWKK